jgi:hypothetical protein
MAKTAGKVDVEVQWSGVDAMLGKLAKISNGGPWAVARGLYKAAEIIMGDAKEFFVPVRHGHLRASGRAHVPKVVGHEVVQLLSFGDAAVKYAWVQHENTRFRHRVGTHHYLSKAIDKNKAIIKACVVESVGAEIRKAAARA